MKKIFAIIAIISLLFSCNNNNKIPDVSAIKINLGTERFERNLFDTSAVSLPMYIRHLQTDNPAFTNTFLTKILNVDPLWPADTAATYVNGFIKAYRILYNDIEKKFADFSTYENEIKFALQLVKYYFPDYKTPEKIVTYIGPPDGFGDILAPEGILVGLHHHLGKDYALYKTEMVQQFYPEYISRQFEPDFITINAIKNIAADIYPEKDDDQPLVNQMIEKGKRLFLLQKLLPKTAAYKLIGYTEDQFKDCNAHEAVIWDMFIKNNLLQSIDKNMMRNYVDEGPTTQELGAGSPGNIGSFAGWQIVNKYMQKNTAITLQQLINIDAETIFREAKYKP